MTMEELRSMIHGYIVENFLFGVDEIDDDAGLIEEGVLDSTGVLEMVVFFDEELGIYVSEEEVVPERFGSVSALAAFAAERLDPLLGGVA